MNINNIINHKLYFFYKYYKNIYININWFILFKINNNDSKLIISYYKNTGFNIL